MKHAATRFAFAVGLPLALSAPVLAYQEPSNTLTLRYRATTAWPASAGTPGTMTRCVSGDFNGDGVTDVMALVGGSPVLMLAPDAWESVSVFGYPSSCLDLDRVPAAVDAKNAFVTVSSTGLVQAKDNGSVGYYYATLSTDSRWTGATMVRSGYLNSNTTPDFIGMCPAHDSVPTKIVVLMDYAGTDTTSSFNLTGLTVYDIGFVRYDGASDNRIWVLDSYGVEVFTASGARIKRFQRTSTLGDAVCTFWKNGDPHEHIAWFRMKSNTTDQELVELHWESDPNAEQRATSTDTITGSDRVVSVVPMASSSQSLATQLSDSDLLMCHLDNYAPIRLRHMSTAIGQMTFDVTALDPVMSNSGATPDPSTIAGSSNMAPLLVADLNHDAAEDVFLPVQGTNGLSFLVWRGGGVNQPEDGAANFMHTPELAGPDAGTNTHTLTIGVDLPSPPADANCLEVTVWSCPVQSTTDPVTYTAGGHYYYQGTDGSGAPIYPPITTNYLWPRLSLALTNGNNDPDSLCFPRLYWLEVRQSARQSDGTLRAKSATYVGVVGSTLSGLTPWVDSDSHTACISLEWGDPSTSSCWSDAGCHAGSNGSITVVAPGAMTRHRIAPTGTPPTPATATQGSLQ